MVDIVSQRVLLQILKPLLRPRVPGMVLCARRDDGTGNAPAGREDVSEKPLAADSADAPAQNSDRPPAVVGVVDARGGGRGPP